MPPVVAGPLRVIVPVDELPPIPDGGERLMPDRPVAKTVRGALKVIAPWVAVIVNGVFAGTDVVDTVTATEDAPDGIVAVAGKVAAELLDERLTVSPLAGAEPFIVTVAVAEVPPCTEEGLTEIPLKAAGPRVIVAFAELLP